MDLQRNPAVAHLLAARDAMMAERDDAVRRYNEGIAKIDALINDLGGETNVVPTPTSSTTQPQAATSADPTPTDADATVGTRRRAVGARAAITEFLAASPIDKSFGEIYDAVKAAAVTASDKSIRNLLDRMANEGKVQKLGRGRYRKPPSVLLPQVIPQGVWPPIGQVAM